MTPSDERRVQEIFQQAADLPLEDRHDFVAATCADRTDIRAKVRLLLQHLDADVSIPVGPLIYSTSSAEVVDTAPAPLPQQIGRYRILGIIGEGGMGTVYEAVQENPRRTVALKVIRAGVASPQTLKRFEREADVLGRLNHPGIAGIFEAGTAHPDGSDPRSFRQPYFAMELVRGVTLKAYLRQQTLARDDKLELLAEICDAVEHAHQHGVVHRDLKPDNILVTANGRPKVLDFGVAVAADPDGRSVTVQTSVGQLLGTVPYMSPEQVTGDNSVVGVRSDVYALGVILYEMLTERLPFDVRHRSIAEAARIISEDEPTNITTFDASYRGDIETIVLRAIEKEPARRYDSAAALAADLRRHLADEPIVARPTTRMYHLRKFARRNRALVSGVVATLVTLALGAVVATVLAVIAIGQRDLARTNEDAAVKSRAQARHQAYLAGVVAAEASWQLGDVGAARASLVAAPADARDWEWHYLEAQLDRSVLTLDDHREQVTALDLRPGLLATASIDRTVRIWKVRVGDVGVPHFDLQHTMEQPGWANAVAFSPDGRLIASTDTAVHLWDVTTGAALADLEGHTEKVRAVAFAPDGGQVASAGGDRTVRIWDTATHVELATLAVHGRGASHLFYAADGRRLVAVLSGGVLRSWDTTTWRSVDASGLPAGFRTVVSAPGSERLMLAGPHRISVWDLRAGRAGTTIERLDHDFDCATWVGGERLALTGGGAGTLRLWDLAGRRQLAWWTGHQGSVRALAAFASGDLLISACNDSTIKVWSRLVNGGPTLFRTPGQRPAYVRFAPDGELLVVKSPEGRDQPSVTFWNGDHAGYRGFPLEGLQIRDVLFAPDGRRIMTGSADGSLRVCDGLTGATLITMPGHDGPIWGLARDSTGRRVASSGRDGTVRVWDIVAGKPIEVLDEHRGGVWSVAFSPDDSMLASIGTDGTVVLRDQVRGTVRVLRPTVADDAVLWGFDVSFHPDGALLAASFGNPWSSTSAFITVWDVESGDEVATMGELLARVDTVAFSPGGTRLAAGLEGGVRLFDTATWRAVATLQVDDRVERLAYSGDGRRIAAGLTSGVVAVWDIEPAAKRLRDIRVAERRRDRAAAEVRERLERSGVPTAVVRSLVDDATLEPALRRAATRLAAARRE